MDNVIEVKYGLTINGELVKCSRSSNRGHDYCGDETVKLNKYADDNWLVDDLDTVLNVLKPGRKNPRWYNADMDNPIVEIDLSQAQPVQVTYNTEYTPIKR